ncbi:hypothetical protein QFZ40_002167 [Arthrobacter pascens]|uniref:ATP-binding protein DrrA1-3 family domain-containing protein n=1 Tax=Arthrobacter pascens TaxID=1677 RepID=UPI00278A5941|nr:DUF4162 domain-containing protein [Arthrobacter pascens]MDQ0634258.1 hypothetical protein [Arthrobacter pascens]
MRRSRHGTDETAVQRELINAGVAVRSFTTERVSLEEIFIRVYGRKATAGA